MSLALDLILLLCILVFAIIGKHKGFVDAVLSLSVVVLSFLLAFLLSGVMSDIVFDNFISERVEDSVSNVLTASVGDTSEEIYGKMPEFIVNTAENIGFDLKSAINDGISQNTDGYVAELAKSVTESVRPPVVAIIRIVIFLILFIFLRIVLKIIAKMLNIVSYIPVLRTMNGAFGFLFGFINGMFTVAAVCFVLSAAVVFNSGIFGITQEVLQNSFIFRFYDLFLNII